MDTSKKLIKVWEIVQDNVNIGSVERGKHGERDMKWRRLQKHNNDVTSALYDSDVTSPPCILFYDNCVLRAVRYDHTGNRQVYDSEDVCERTVNTTYKM